VRDISTREVFSLFWESGEKQGSVAVLFRTWFDETYDGKREKYAVAGGLVGRHGLWANFSQKWKAVLHEKPRINHFHMKELRGLDGEFLQFRDPVRWPKPTGSQAANVKRDKLKALIEGNPNIGALGIGVLIEDFNLVRAADPKAAELLRPDPYEFALQVFVYETAKLIRRVSVETGRGPNGDCVAFVSDEDEKAAIYTAAYTDFKKKNPDIAEVMHGLAHLDDKKWAPLQAADMIASFVNHRFNEMLKIPEDERKLRESLPEFQGVFYKIAHADKWYLCSYLADTAGLSLFDKLGIKRRENMSEEEMDAKKKAGITSFRPIHEL
jgi:hypothetical protein